jgi:hypothetical protein
MTEEKNYLVFKTYRNINRKTVLAKNLTRKEAQDMVKEDIKINPKAEKYMVCFDKMN